MKKYILILISATAALAFSCKKGPGEGGQTSIIGKVWQEKYLYTIHDAAKDHWALEQDVYIIYGDEISYGNRTRTGPDGLFEFKYLREGNYTIFVYSDSLSSDQATVLKKAVKKQIDIPDDGTADLGTLVIQKISTP